MIELTPEQRQAVERQNGEPVRVVDPATQHAYVILRAEDYQRLVGVPARPVEEPELEVPAILRRGAEAFWRDLPELLKKWRYRGKWVVYLGDERIGIARDADDLIRECVRRGIPISDYYLDLIERRQYPPWHTIDLD
jgi:hypothetical protein